MKASCGCFLCVQSLIVVHTVNYHMCVCHTFYWAALYRVRYRTACAIVPWNPEFHRVPRCHPIFLDVMSLVTSNIAVYLARACDKYSRSYWIGPTWQQTTSNLHWFYECKVPFKKITTWQPLPPPTSHTLRTWQFVFWAFVGTGLCIRAPVVPLPLSSQNSETWSILYTVNFWKKR